MEFDTYFFRMKDHDCRLYSTDVLCEKYNTDRPWGFITIPMRLPVPTAALWLVWRSGNGVRRIDEVKLRRARLVLGLATTSGGSTIPVCLSRPLRPTQPGHPSVGRCNEYRRWFRPSLGRKGASEVKTLWRFINQFINKYKNKFIQYGA